MFVSSSKQLGTKVFSTDTWNVRDKRYHIISSNIGHLKDVFNSLIYLLMHPRHTWTVCFESCTQSPGWEMGVATWQQSANTLYCLTVYSKCPCANFQTSSLLQNYNWVISGPNLPGCLCRRFLSITRFLYLHVQLGCLIMHDTQMSDFLKHPASCQGYCQSYFWARWLSMAQWSGFKPQHCQAATIRPLCKALNPDF